MTRSPTGDRGGARTTTGLASGSANTYSGAPAGAASAARGPSRPAAAHTVTPTQRGGVGTDPIPARMPPGEITVGGLALGPGWALAPLRLFLGVTFVYAGLQKLTDPGFFKPGARDYIGGQIAAFAHGSPIGGLLLHGVLPHATFFGGLVAYGELAIGFGVLVGLLARPAAFFGLLLSITFFLSATWHVYPYFYGADIVFTFAWITLWLAPHAGLPSADAALAARLRAANLVESPRRARLLAFALAVSARALTDRDAPGRPAPGGRPGQAVPARGNSRRAGRTAYARQESRRGFLLGIGAGALGALGLTWLWSATHPATTPAAPATSGSGGASSAGAVGTATSGSSTVIARASDVPANSAANFTLANGDPGVLIHLVDGRFVAFDATCTHAGCPVQYDAGARELYCPCHGAVFDPAQQAAVLQGPAPTPLLSVAVTVSANGDITASS